MNDASTLGRFVALGDQEAFRRLVERHINLVYAAARRQVVDPGMAQDVSQAVFILLSRKAARLQGRGNLEGWLIQATHYVCRDALKREQRRRYYEARARKMNEERLPPKADQTWDAIRPLLDEALIRLSGTSRTAVALRYLEDRTLREVGEALGISEEAARKRVDRAIDQLRRALTAKGAVAPAALGTVLLTNAAQAAPAGVLVAVTAPATPVVGALAAGGARLLLWAHMKLAVVAGLIIVCGAAVSVPFMRDGSAANAAAVASATPATLAATTPAAVASTILYRGVLVDPAGNPVPNAAVRVYDSRYVRDSLKWDGKAATDGSFSIGPLSTMDKEVDGPCILLFDAPGFALTWKGTPSVEPFNDPEDLRITLSRATEVMGTLTNARGQPVANAVVEASIALKDEQYFGGHFEFNRQTGLAATSDAQGKFRFDRIPEKTRLQLTVRHPDYQTWSTLFRASNASVYVYAFPVAAGTSDADIQLEDRPATLRVQLMLDGKPLNTPGIMLVARDRTNLSIWKVETALTDDTGRAVFTGLGRGTWDVYTSGSPKFIRAQIMPVVDIVLQPGDTRDLSAEVGTIPVRITEFEGNSTRPGTQPVSIQVADTGRYMTGAHPDATGSAEVFLPPGRYQLVCSSWEAGENIVVHQDFTVAAELPVPNLTIRANVGPTLRGQLVDSTGKPVPGSVVMDDRTSANAGADGRFSMRLYPSPWTQLTGVAIDSKRRLARGFVTQFPAPGDPELKLVLEPMGTIIGQAVDAAGKPLPDTKVDISVPVTDGGNVQLDHWIWRIAMGDDGTFRATNVPTGYEMDVHLRNCDQFADAKVALQPGETQNLGALVLHGPVNARFVYRNLPPDPTLVLPPREVWDLTINGRVLDESGKPVVGMRLQAIPQSQVIAESDGEAVTDLKGRFSMSGLSRNRTLTFAGSGYRWNLTPGSAPVELRLSPEAKAAATRPSRAPQRSNFTP